MKTNSSKNQYKSPQSLRVIPAVAILSVLTIAPFAHTFVMADQYDDQINAVRADNSQKQAVQGQLGAEASSLGDAINKLQAEIDSLQNKINENQARVADLQKQIIAAQAELDHQRDLLGQTIKAMYVEGDISTVEMLASSKDLSDFFDKQQYRESVRSKIKTTLDKITKLKLDLNTQKETVEKLLKEQQGLQGQLAAQRAEKDRTLALNQQQQADLDAQIKANNARISQLKAEQAAAYAAYARKNGVTSYGVGAAGNGGYPSIWANAPQDSLIDSWGMYNRECVSYVAWKVSSTGRYMPYWGGVGNAYQWIGNAQRAGIPVTTGAPIVGSVAVWDSYDGLGFLGHVAYVEVVNGDGSIEVSQYNFVHGQFSRMHVPASDVRRLDFIRF